MHKSPYKHRFIAGSSKCSTKPLYILLTKLLTHIKHIFRLRNSLLKKWGQSDVDPQEFKKLLEHLQSPNFNHNTSIKSFDFSTLYTTIPHQKLKSSLATIIWNPFIHKNGTLRFEKQVHWRWHHQHARVSFSWSSGNGFPTDSRHSSGHKSCPSPSRHFSVLIRSGSHTVFALNWKEKVSISVQLCIQIHRWRIINQ